VQGPFWSDDNSYRMYKIMTKLKDNPDFEVQVFRRYSDFEWLIQVLQVEEPTCIVPPIPTKYLGMGQTYLESDDPKLLERVSGMQHFLDYMLQHNQLCANKILEVFLTGQDHMLEQTRVQTRDMGDLNTQLSEVLKDGSNFMKELDQEKSRGYVGSIMKAGAMAGSGLLKIGGLFSGAISSGANLVGLGSNQQTD